MSDNITPRCETCGATEDLEMTVWRSLADGTETARYQCNDRGACNDRRFPELAAMAERLDALAANSFGRDSADNLVRSLWESAHKMANDRLVHRLDALEVRLEEIETALRDVLVLAPYLKTFSERVTVLEERAGHPYAA